MLEEACSACKELLSLQDSVADKCQDAVFKQRKSMEKLEEMSSMDNIWEKIDGNYMAFAEFRDISLDRFHRQAMLQSGAVQRSNLKILQQGISAQVIDNLCTRPLRPISCIVPIITI